ADLVLIFGIHGVGATARGFGWNSVGGRKLAEESIRAGQVMRNFALRPDDLFHAFTRIGCNLAADFVDVVTGSNHWLGEISGIADHGHEREVVAVADEMLGESGAVAAGQSVTPDPTFF